jgi:hypothetical protein
MYNSDTEVLFPPRVIPLLREHHGEQWGNLIDRVRSADSTPAERYAFELMMVRLCGCVGCDADSFRAMRGCTQCARQAVRRFRGSDQDIIDQFWQVKKEIDAYIVKNPPAGPAEKKSR